MSHSDKSTLAVTQLYFKLSNAADLTAVEKLIQPDATYSSAHTGLFYGIADIMSMMSAFYKGHQSLHWHIESIEALTEFITEVHFSCVSTDLQGQYVKRSGIERLVVVDGLIRHIEVR